MIQYKKILMTLALLITAVGGAWADQTYTITFKANNKTKTIENVTLPHTFTSVNNQGNGELDLIINDLYNQSEGWCVETPTVSGNSNVTAGLDGSYNQYITISAPFEGNATVSASHFYNNPISSFTYTLEISIPGYIDGPAVTTNAASEQDLFTEAWFTMPASDVTVDYELVRDMQDATNPVAFSGLPATGNIVVKKGDGGTYQPAEALTIQLIDPLAAAEAQNIIGAEGLTLNVYPMVEVVIFEDLKGWKADETATPVALADFLASPQPGRWMIKATAETGLYDGTLYSPEFTLAEAYDLTLSPATNANLKSVTVAGTAKTADENGVIKNIEPTKKVKITTTGPDYIIRGAKVKKTVNMKTLQIGGETTATIYYIEGESWTDAITNHPTENAGWKAFSNQITYDGSAYVLFYGGSTTKVNPGEKIDSTKSYKLES